MSIDWHVHPVAPDLRLRITGPMPPLAAADEAAIDAAWAAAQARMGGRLFNGRVFSADRIAPGLIEGHWTEFRRIVARMDHPELGHLPVRPLAVGGAISGGAGEDRFVILGRRPAGAVYQAGQWQLPPAGSIDPGALRPGSDTDVDPLAQLHAELSEELGMPPDSVTDPRPLCVVEHPGSGVLDLGIALCTGWTAAQVLAAHAARGNGEYDPLLTVPLAGLADFLARHAGAITRQAPVFLARAGLLAA